MKTKIIFKNRKAAMSHQMQHDLRKFLFRFQVDTLDLPLEQCTGTFILKL